MVKEVENEKTNEYCNMPTNDAINNYLYNRL